MGLLAQRVVNDDSSGVHQTLFVVAAGLVELDQPRERAEVPLAERLSFHQTPVVVEAGQEVPSVEVDGPNQGPDVGHGPLVGVFAEKALELPHVQPEGRIRIEPDGVGGGDDVRLWRSDLTEHALDLPEGVAESPTGP